MTTQPRDPLTRSDASAPQPATPAVTPAAIPPAPERPDGLQLYGIATAALLLRVMDATLWRWVRHGAVPAQQLGGVYLLQRTALLQPFSALPPLPEEPS